VTWVALVLVGLGLADLGHALRPVRFLPETAAAAITVGLGLLGGFTTGRDVVALLVIALVVLAWGSAVRQGFGRRMAWLPLTVLAVALAAALLASPWGTSGGGPLGHWLASTQVPLLHGLTPQRALLVLGGVLVQGSTGNVLVRLVLLATHTIHPERVEAPDPGPRLKGGRLLGPMERLVILGLGLAGDYTAAGIVVAAKGLLRYPELQAARDDAEGPSVTVVTEYFLVGSFVSWLVALATLVLLAT
jgi:hypothetical protein